MNCDVLIVGQGLAGSLLGWELMHRRQRIVVIDPSQENASLIAGGLINPVTGKRLVKPDNIEQLLAAAYTCYRQLEQQFNDRFYLEKPMLRILRSQAEQDYAKKRQADYKYQPFIAHDIPSTSGWIAPFGALQQQQTGYLQTRALLSKLKTFFIAHNSFRQSRFDYQQLQINREGIIWQDINARQIVFCEGFRCRNNPWFSWLPLQPVKGEILTFSSSTKLPDKLFNYGHWLIPTETAKLYRTGATFDRQRLDTEPSDSGKQQLLDSLHTAYPLIHRPKIIAHNANIRPCTLDKQAFIGRHPEHSQLLIFNGFGAKGSLLIPWYSHNLTEHLLQQQTLCPLADIKRYYGLKASCYNPINDQ